MKRAFSVLLLSVLLMSSSGLLPFLSDVGPAHGEVTDVADVMLDEYIMYKTDDPLAWLRDEITRLEASGFGDALGDVVDAVLTADRAVFLYFYAEWCHFCAQERPIVDALEVAYEDRVVVIRVDGERNPAAMTAFGIAGYPSMFLIVGSEGENYVSREFRGFTAEAVLTAAFHALVDTTLAQPWDPYDEYYTYQVERSSSFDRVDGTPNELSEGHTCDSTLCADTCEHRGIELVWGPSGFPFDTGTNTDYQTLSDIIMYCFDTCYNRAPRFWPFKYGHECRDGVAADVRRPFCAGRYGLWVEDCNNCEKNYVYIPCGSGKECQYDASAGRAICVSTSQPTCDDDDDCTNDYGSYPNCWYTRIPGCDNPDDNVAISAYTSATPPGDALGVPTVGVLFHGFALEVMELLDALGYATVPVNLSLGGLDAFPVVVIPSGGLAGLDASPTFTTRLAAYVADGGTLLVFSQQHGDEYAALPGGALTGYGWLEDQSCHFASVAIDAYHPIHAGQTRSTLNLNVDGFFTASPVNSTVLLRRTKNGMPAMLLYEHGQGSVVASTLYSDMAASLYQDTVEEVTLIRDLVAWATTSGAMPSYPRGTVTITLNVTNPYTYPAHAFTPGNLVTLQVNVTNRGDVTSETVKFVLSDPYHDAFTTMTQTVAATISPNASTLLEYTYQTDGTSLPGIWSLNYFLYAGDDLVHADRGAQFALAYDVSDASSFTASAQVLGPDRTIVKQINTPLTIAPGATGSFDVVLFAGDLGIYELLYTVDSTIEATIVAGRYPLAVSAFTGTPGGYARQGLSFDFLVTSDDEYYLPDDNITFTFNLWNHDSENHTVRVEWVHRLEDNRTVDVPAGGFTAFEDTVEAATFRTDQHRLYANLRFPNGTLISRSVRVFNVVDREVTPTITVDQPTYAEGDTVHLTVTLFNPMPKSVATTAVVTVTHEGHVLYAQNYTRNVDALVSSLVTTNFTLPVDSFGPFYAHVTAYPAEACAGENVDACILGSDGHVFEVPTIISSLHIDQPEYRARDTVTMALHLFNNMQGTWNQTVTVAVPTLSLIDTSSVHLDPGSNQAVTYTVTLTADLSPGSYDVTVTFVEEGDTVRYEDAFYVSPSNLLFSGVVMPSGNLGLQIGNTGGVDTTYNVTYSLLDLLAPDTAIDTTVQSGTVQAGETTVHPVPLPLGLVAQTYYLTLTLTDETTGASTDVTVPLFIDGVSVTVTSDTDHIVYTSDDPISILSSIAVTEPIANATLHLEILAAQPLPPVECVVPIDDLIVTEDVVLCPGTYAINDTSRDGVIRVFADDVVIEGNHTVLIGSGTTTAGWGISNDGYDHVVVRNLEIQGYERGISFRNSEYHNIENVTIVLPSYTSTIAPRFTGIYLNNVHRSDLVGNNLSTNIQYGLYAVSSTLNTISDNTIYTTFYGMYLETQSNTNTITSNRVTGGPYSYDTWNSRYGLSVLHSHNNTIAENDFSYLYMGINLWYADNNTVKSNDVSGSTTQWQSGYTGYFGGSGYGMQLYNANNNTITDNNASSHGAGFRLYGSDGNVLTNNLVKFNSYHDNYNRYYGIGVDLDNSDGNVFLGNNVSENYYGLYLVNSENNTFRDTELTSNSYSFEVNTARYTTRGFDNDVDPSNLVNGQPIYYLLDAQDVVLDAASNAGVVYCIRCANLTVRDLLLSHSGAGIYLYATVGAQLLNNTLAANRYGIYLRASTAVSMQDSAIAVTGLDPQAGIELYDAPSNEILANTLTGIEMMYGLNLYESDDIVIADNEFTGQGIAIYLQYSESILIEGNTITNGGTAIYFRAEYESGISINNTIRDNVVHGTSAGLTATYFYDSLIADNNFTDCGSGINLQYALNTVVIGNNASHHGWNAQTSGSGISVESSENLQLLNNTANTNYATGIFLGLSRNCTLSGNNVTDNRSQGIRLWSSHNNTITDNVVHDNGYLTYNGEGIYLGNNYYQPYGSHNNTITNNSLRYNHRYGIWLHHSSANNTLSDNLICANVLYDVYSASSLNVGYRNTCNTTSNWNDVGATNCTYTCPANGNGGSPAPPMSLCPTCAPALSPTEPQSSSTHTVAEMPPIAPSSSNEPLSLIEQPLEPLAITSPVAYAPSDGGTLPDYVIWTQDLPVSVDDVEELTTAVGALNVTGKLFLAATLRASTGRVLAYSLNSFYVTDQEVAVTMATDQRLYAPGDTVTVTGTVENLDATGGDFVFQLQANGSAVYAETVFLEAGATHDYTTQVTANATFTLVGIVDGVAVTDVVRVETPVITATLTVPEVAGLDTFAVELVLKNTGNVTAELIVQLLDGTEAVVVPAHTLTVLSVETTITENTTLTASISGDVSLILQRDVTFGEAATLVVTPDPLYVPGVVAIPYFVTSTGVLDTRFIVTFTVLGEPVTREVALPPGGNLSDVLLVTLPQGVHQVAYTTPFASGVVAVNVAGDPAFTVTWLPDDLVFDLAEVATINVTVANTGGQLGEAVLRLESPGLFDVVARAWIDAGATRNVSATVALPDDVADGTYPLYVYLDDATHATTFTMWGALIAVTGALDHALYAVGENATLTVTVENLRDVPLDLYARVQLSNYSAIAPLILMGLESTQLSFAVPVTVDDGKLLFAVYMASGRSIYINSLYLTERPPSSAGITLWTERQVYGIGDTVSVTVNVTVAGQLVISGPNLTVNTTVEPGVHVYRFELPTLRSGVHPLVYTFGNYTASYPIDVDGYNARILSTRLDRVAYTAGDPLNLTLLIDVNRAFDGVVRIAIQAPDGRVVGDGAVDHTFAVGENRVHLHTVVLTNVSGVHSVVAKVYAYGSTIFLASGARYFDATSTDDEPPSINHLPVTSGVEGTAIPVAALVTDDVAVVAVALYYRPVGATSYTRLPMPACALCIDTYNATIPATAVTTDLEYYLNASDGTHFALSGSVASPHLIRVDLHPVAVTLSTPTDITHNALTLAWTASEDADFANYTVYQSTAPGVLGTAIATITDGSTTTYVVTGLASETTYAFTVRVTDTGGLSADSTQVSATTTAPPPTVFPWLYLLVILAVVGVAATVVLRKMFV